MAVKRRRFMKISLLETSAVGVPAYPDAHFSLAKALSDTQIIERGSKEMKKENEAPVEEVEEVLEDAEEVEEEVVEEDCEECEDAEEVGEKGVLPVTQLEEAKSVKEIANEIAKSIKEAMNSERGLVEKTAETKETLKNASLGELAIASGLFSTNN
tara:strand:- start:687 stop:1154 length:468 start_codon:yes stop_codon:yes gene_type:complete